jgi:hypothetical protein
VRIVGYDEESQNYDLSVLMPVKTYFISEIFFGKDLQIQRRRYVETGTERIGAKMWERDNDAS